MSWNISKILAPLVLLAIPLLQGCVGPARYDAAKFGTIQQVSILGFSENELNFWADIDRSGNAYSAAGANNSKADRFSELLSNRLKEIYPKMQDSLTATLQSHGIEVTAIPAPRNSVGMTESQYSSVKVPLLLECKIHLGFVLVNGGIMPTATIFYKLLASKDTNSTTRDLRLERHLSIGYGPYSSWTQPEVIGFPKKLYPNESYVLNHPDEVAADLISMASELGNAAALTLHQSAQ